MTLHLSRYVRKPFYVESIQVTPENINEIAAWCKGELLHAQNPQTKQDEAYVKVPVLRAMTERQTKAFVGDWVLYAGNNFKVYSPKAFESVFEPAGKDVEKEDLAGVVRTLELTYGPR